MADLEPTNNGANSNSENSQNTSLKKTKADYINFFVCCNCKGSLFSLRFVKMDSKPWCVPCYNEKFTPTCTYCSEKIGVDDNDIEYHGLHWHNTCFYCSECKVSLFEKTFACNDGVIFCGDCYTKTNNRGCEICQKPFKRGGRVVVYKNQQIHHECFACYQCKNPIEGSSSQRSDNAKEHKMHEGEAYCIPCYEELWTLKCTDCKKPIKLGEQGVYHMEDPYHQQCLVCEHCKTELCDVRYYAFEGHKFCIDCFEEPNVFGKLCWGCGEKITGVCDKAFFMVEDLTWHAKCFKCCRCSDALDPEKPFVCPSEQQGDTTDIYCEKCGVEMLTDMRVLVEKCFDFKDQ